MLKPIVRTWGESFETSPLVVHQRTGVSCYASSDHLGLWICPFPLQGSLGARRPPIPVQGLKQEVDTIFQLDAIQSASHSSFLIASSAGILRYEDVPGQPAGRFTPINGAGRVDWTTVTCGAEDDRMIFGGRRAGVIDLFDNRSEDQIRILSGQTIASMKAVNARQLVVRDHFNVSR